jgi:probable F420-dependent oxidoreductase
MKVDGGVGFHEEGIAEQARRSEALGYDGLWSAETSHDPFLILAQAASSTERVALGTGIAVAFARNPMNLAVVANDLQLLSKGRFMLGLGSQIKAHITKRYAMPWSRPAARMRELILAMRAIWEHWADPSVPLAFRGEFYTHTLMTPFFNPGPNPYGNPKVFLAGVGERMTEVAGEVADGLIAHGFTTERYLREVTVPSLLRGAERAGRRRQDLEISYPGFVVTGGTDEEVDKAAAAVKSQIAFYGSTPAYRGVLELHGWGDLQPELNARSRRGEWEAMGQLITDEMLETFAIVAPLEDVPRRVGERFGGVVDRFSFYAPYQVGDEDWAAILGRFGEL